MAIQFTQSDMSKMLEKQARMLSPELSIKLDRELTQQNIKASNLQIVQAIEAVLKQSKPELIFSENEDKKAKNNLKPKP